MSKTPPRMMGTMQPPLQLRDRIVEVEFDLALLHLEQTESLACAGPLEQCLLHELVPVVKDLLPEHGGEFMTYVQSKALQFDIQRLARQWIQHHSLEPESCPCPRPPPSKVSSIAISLPFMGFLRSIWRCIASAFSV